MSDRSGLFLDESVPACYDRLLAPYIFTPWARDLVERADLRRGSTVLDVACGPGTVAVVAAAAVGPAGRVVGCDFSATMLARAASRPPQDGSAPIEFRECPAGELDAPDGAFDAVLCQQGLQFFPDRAAALSEMRRVLVDGGVALLSTWASERELGLFGAISEAARDGGLPEPFPGAFDPSGFAVSSGEAADVLEAAGLREVTVELVERECVWESPEAIAETITGTPYGPLFAAADEPTRRRIKALILERIEAPDSGEVRIATASHVARGIR
ncbi:MAG TPA: methyltransferase domain-containing protein [Solirubrobacteraceae bacterium]|jgi:SAM-dependent methyltransferase|nr:methyltransferase domain-containing protein [Solirubrobacteraceae bacterium]